MARLADTFAHACRALLGAADHDVDDFARFADLLRARFAGAFRFRGAARLVRFLGAPAANLP
jgi:hypothetical protein